MTSCARPICIGHSASSSICRRGLGFSAASASPGASGCAWRSKNWGPSSSNSARLCRRGAICCRPTLPTSSRNFKTASRRSTARSRWRPSKSRLGSRSGIFSAASTPSRSPRPRLPRCTWPRSRTGARSSSRYCVPGCARSSTSISKYCTTWPNWPTNIGARRAACVRSNSCASTARPSWMSWICCAKPAMPRS